MRPLNMQHLEFEPPEALRDAIKCFWYDSRDFGNERSGLEVVPDGNAEIIFYFGNTCSVSYHGALQPLPSPFMIGLLNKPAVFYTQNRLQIIGIRCFPWTVYDLLGLPPGKDGVRSFEHPVAKLQPGLNACIEAGSIDGALALVKQYFINERARVVIGGMLLKAGTAMRAANGTMPVSGVAAAAHATLRTLERNFRQSSGHTVKDVSVLMRFEQVRNHLWLNPGASLAGLAHELGYADQSHLSREFKRYSGTTPAVFARKTREGMQAPGGDFVAFIQA